MGIIRGMAKKSPASREQLVSQGRQNPPYIQIALKENVVSIPRKVRSAMEFERITFG